MTLVTGDNLGDTKTLIIAAGASSKGLGAAGIDENDELNRAADLVKKAKEKNIKIVVVHIGGEARRGDLSDKFINPVLNSADHIIVVKGGDKYGLFTNAAKSKGIPIDV